MAQTRWFCASGLAAITWMAGLTPSAQTAPVETSYAQIAPPAGPKEAADLQQQNQQADQAEKEVAAEASQYMSDRRCTDQHCCDCARTHCSGTGPRDKEQPFTVGLYRSHVEWIVWMSVVSAEGIEPSTHALKVRCSTN